MKRWGCLLALCLCLLCLPALAQKQTEAGSVTAALNANGAQVQVRSTLVEGEEWLFLPAFADVETLYPEACETEEEGVWYDDASGLYLMQSENLRALFLFSDDPVNQGRAYIDGCEKHVNGTTGAMALISPDGTVDHADTLRQLRGRGNSTWKEPKKPYQFKLENRADLLRTGVKSERNRTWVLLADHMDPTFLHNRIAMDLALEMGMEETSHSEHVDLYYDGEYRGLYLLSEKVEVGEGRLDVGDYDAIMEALNKSIGIRDPEQLPVVNAEDQYTYIEGLAGPEDPGAGTWMLEMESETNTLSDRCWLRMEDGKVLASKNPENATEEMMRFIRTRLQEARDTLENGGVNPHNGRTIWDDFDVEAFAKLFAVNEMGCNADSYTYSSSWFILPAGQMRFEPGTPWDFDLGMRWMHTGYNEGGAGSRAVTGWAAAFYGCDDFANAFARVCREEMLPLVSRILLGEEKGAHLKPLDEYAQEIRASAQMNNRIWESGTYGDFRYVFDFDQEIEQLRAFLSQRHSWLDMAVASTDSIVLWGHATYGHVDGENGVYVCPWNKAQILSADYQQLTEADEENYALWQLEVILAPREGHAFEDPSVIFGTTPVGHEQLDDGTIRILVTFEDPSYRPVDYYGDDIGMVYNPDVYALNYPEIAAEYEDDPEGLMDYFCDEGMYEDHKGNAFFQPSEILHRNPDLMDMLGEDWQMYYWEFLYYGYSDGWLLPGVSPGFGLKVTDALE